MSQDATSIKGSTPMMNIFEGIGEWLKRDRHFLVLIDKKEPVALYRLGADFHAISISDMVKNKAYGLPYRFMVPSNISIPVQPGILYQKGAMSKVMDIMMANPNFKDYTKMKCYLVSFDEQLSRKSLISGETNP